MRIAVDFDGTINEKEEEYPFGSTPNMELINFLIDMKKQGHKIILSTLRENEVLDYALEYCEKLGLKFDKINENLDKDIQKWGYDPRKISADYYIDDRNLTLENYKKIKGNKNEEL